MVGMEAARRIAALVPDAKLEIVEGGYMASSGSSPDGRRRMLDFVEMVP